MEKGTKNLFTIFRYLGPFFSWTRQPLSMLLYTPLIKSVPVPGLYWSWEHLLLTLSYNVRNSFCRSKTTKYIDAEIACYGSQLELHDKHSFVSVFDKHGKPLFFVCLFCFVSLFVCFKFWAALNDVSLTGYVSLIFSYYAILLWLLQAVA